MNKKYTLIKTDTKIVAGTTLYRIQAISTFGAVAQGELGGYVEFEKNVDVYGNAWVSGNAWVYGNAWVSGDARVSGDADLLVICPIGSRKSSATFTKSDQSVATGCFRGTIQEFEVAVIKTHGDNQHAQAYLKAIELAKIIFEL